jgi:protein-S-isoprenylcysteine O-methyltransferase Ste14
MGRSAAWPPGRVPERMVRALVQALLSTMLFGAALLAPAGAWRWRQAWVLIALYFLIDGTGAARVHRANPTLLAERAKLPVQRGQSLPDKILLLAFMATYAGELVLTGLDRWRWHWGQPLPSLVAWPGLALFSLGWVLVMRSLETNAFATTVVRHQAERGHTVVDRGVYGIVRHPMYAGLVLALLGVPLWLRSPLGLAAAVVPIALLAGRIVLEEQVLIRALPAYADYAARVRSRLIPGLW